METNSVLPTPMTMFKPHFLPAKLSDFNKKFLEACYNGNLSIVRECVELGVDVSISDNWGLWVACRYGNLNVIKFLVLECSVDVNYQDANGYNNSDLWTACIHNHLDVVRFLLENGAKITSNGTFDYISKYLSDWDAAKTAIIEYKLKNSL